MMDEWGNDYDDKMVSCKNNMNFISFGLRKTKKSGWYCLKRKFWNKIIKTCSSNKKKAKKVATDYNWLWFIKQMEKKNQTSK